MSTATRETTWRPPGTGRWRRTGTSGTGSRWRCGSCRGRGTVGWCARGCGSARRSRPSGPRSPTTRASPASSPASPSAASSTRTPLCPPLPGRGAGSGAGVQVQRQGHHRLLRGGDEGAPGIPGAPPHIAFDMVDGDFKVFEGKWSVQAARRHLDWGVGERRGRGWRFRYVIFLDAGGGVSIQPKRQTASGAACLGRSWRLRGGGQWGSATGRGQGRRSSSSCSQSPARPPSTRSSPPQFLKFVEKTAPVAVYTSGKGPSAAGLTSSVTRDSNSEEVQRQLEAIIRLSESVAKMRLTSVATPAHIEAAFRLFNVSTVDVARSGINEHLNLSPEIANEIKVANSGAGLRLKQIPHKKQVHIIEMKGEEDKLNQINSELKTSTGWFGSTIQMSQQSCSTLSDGCCTSISNATGDFIPIAQVFHEAIYYLQWFTVTMNGNFEAMYVLVSMGMASDQKVKPPTSLATGHLVEARQLLSPPQRMLCGNMGALHRLNWFTRCHLLLLNHSRRSCNL